MTSPDIPRNMQSRQGHTIFVILNLIQNLQKSVPFVNANARTYNENSTFPLMRARLSIRIQVHIKNSVILNLIQNLGIF